MTGKEKKPRFYDKLRRLYSWCAGGQGNNHVLMATIFSRLLRVIFLRHVAATSLPWKIVWSSHRDVNDMKNPLYFRVLEDNSQEESESADEVFRDCTNE